MIDRVVRVRALPRAGETVAALSTAAFAGGKGANQAAAAALCGARVRMLGRGGVDSRFIVQALREAGVRTWSISLEDERAGAATVMVAENGENAIVIAPEANTRISIKDIERFLEGARQGEIVLFQNECSCLHEGIAAAAARGLRVWLNAAPADARLGALKYEKLTGLVVNETEAEALTGERETGRALELLAARMPGGTVIVTLGAGGAIAATGSARYAHRGFVVDAVDTVGCGDAFVGAYLSGVFAGLDVPRALARGNAAGALAAMREGAIPSLPSKAEVEVAERLPEGTRLKPRAGGMGGKPPRCEVCDYDIAGQSLGDACPECGNTIVPSRFAGGWRTQRGRRRFGLWARVFFAGVSLHAIAAAMVVVYQWNLGGRIPVTFVAYGVALMASLVLIPCGMLGLSIGSAVSARCNQISIGAAALRIVAPALLAGASLWGSRNRPWVDLAVIGVVVADGAFAWSIAGFTRGTKVNPVPRRRHQLLVALAAVSVAIAFMSYRIGPPNLLFMVSAALLVWTALEVRGIAGRLKALEPA